MFIASETIHHRRRRGEKHEHREQFNRATIDEISRESLGLTKPYCKLVAIRSPQNLFMLEKALSDTDPVTTEVVVVTAKVEPPGALGGMPNELDLYDQQLMTAVVERAERLGKSVRPVIVPTNNAIHAVLRIASVLAAQEVILGASNKFTVEEQFDQIAFYWIELHAGAPTGLTVHVVSATHDLTFDLEGGNRIPTAAERQARSVADLRSAGFGVKRILMVHDGSRISRDVCEWLVTMLAADITLDVASVRSEESPNDIGEAMETDRVWAARLGRTLHVAAAEPQRAPEIVRILREGPYDAVVLPVPQQPGSAAGAWADYVRQHAPCSVFLAAHPTIPREVLVN